MMQGMLLVNKPAGMTSHDVAQVVRRKLGVRRVGHTGTLDPMAEGLLILLVGEATKHQAAFQHHEKAYEATVWLGTRTDTGDATGRAVETTPVLPLDPDGVAGVLASMRGAVSQTPPSYSAVKVRGRPAYWWARRNAPVALRARTVQIAELTLVRLTPPTLTFRVRCSAGTYVRTLAEQIAQRLGTVGHLTALTRVRIGEWTVEDAKPLAWIQQADPASISHALLPVPASPTLPHA